MKGFVQPAEWLWAPFRQGGHWAHDHVPPFRWFVHGVARLWGEYCTCEPKDRQP